MTRTRYTPGYESSVRTSLKARIPKGHFWGHLAQLLSEFDRLKDAEVEEKEKKQAQPDPLDRIIKALGDFVERCDDYRGPGHGQAWILAKSLLRSLEPE